MFGNKLKDLRTKKKLTQSQMAIAIDTVQTTYSGWEKDKREPSYDTLKKIANFFNVSIDYLLDNEKYERTTTLAKMEIELNKEQIKKLEEMCKLLFPDEYAKIKDAQ